MGTTAIFAKHTINDNNDKSLKNKAYQTVEAVVKEEQEYGLLLQRELAVTLSQGSIQHTFEKERKVLWLLFECLRGT